MASDAKPEFPAMQLLAMVVRQSGADGIVLQKRTILEFPPEGLAIEVEEFEGGLLLRLVPDGEQKPASAGEGSA